MYYCRYTLKTDLRGQFCLFIWVALCLTSCSAYRQNVLFTTEDLENATALKAASIEAEGAYKIQPYDYITLEVFTNKGERIIDPNLELLQSQNVNQARQKQDPQYLVQESGFVKLPIIDTVRLAGLTLVEANQYLEQRYNAFYIDAFVITKFVNKRVIVLGAPGGMVIPLTNENISLIEVLALAGGLNDLAKGSNIRVIRGDLNHPQVQVIDLTTIEGMKRGNLTMQPGDIVYIEPVRRVVTESIRDIAPLVTLLTSVITLYILSR